MVLLPDGEKISKISLFVLVQLTNVSDRRTDKHRMPAVAALMHSIARQKPHSNGSLYSNTVIGTLTVDGWTATFGIATVPTSYYTMWHYKYLCL